MTETGLQRYLADPLGGLTDDEWDSLSGGHFYSSSRWLRYCARLRPRRSGAMIAGVAGGGRAAAPVADLSGSAPHLYRWNDLLTNAGLPPLAPESLLIGPTQGYQTHLLSNDAGRDSAAAMLFDAVQQLRQDESLSREGSCVAMYLGTEDVRSLREAGIRSLPVLLNADAWIEVPDGGWDAWLDTFPRKRRQAIRAERRRFDQAGYQMRHLRLGDCYQRLGSMASATQAKYGHDLPASLCVSIMRQQARVFRDAAKVAVCVQADGQWVGFCLYYEWAGTVFLRWSGFNYGLSRGVGEHFNLAYYTHVIRSQETGVRRLHAGMDSAASKSLRGAELRPLWMLDMAPEGILTSHEHAVRAHNRAVAEHLDNPATMAGAVRRADSWEEFT